jgi:hypothetical protein
MQVLKLSSQRIIIFHWAIVLVGMCTRVYRKVSGLAAWSENCKSYSSLPLGAVVSLFCETVYWVLPLYPLVMLLNGCFFCCKRIFRYQLSPETFDYTLVQWLWTQRFVVAQGEYLPTSMWLQEADLASCLFSAECGHSSTGDFQWKTSYPLGALVEETRRGLDTPLTAAPLLRVAEPPGTRSLMGCMSCWRRPQWRQSQAGTATILHFVSFSPYTKMTKGLKIKVTGSCNLPLLYKLVWNDEFIKNWWTRNIDTATLTVCIQLSSLF